MHTSTGDADIEFDLHSEVSGRHRLDRRTFLGIAGGVGAAGALAATLGPRAWDALFGGASDPRGSLGGDHGGRLVLVTLYGGNDGLNTVIPAADPQYAAGRGGLAVAADTVLPLRDGFGLHPSLKGFHDLWRQGHLAVVHGVGYADPNYSHFESMDIWQTGQPTQPDSTGWLGRWLDLTKASPLQAVGVGPTTSTLLVGEHVQGAALPLGPVALPGGSADQALYGDVARAEGAAPGLLSAAAQGNSDLLTVVDHLGTIVDQRSASHPLGTTDGPSAASNAALALTNGGGDRSATGILTAQLSLVANLILGGATSTVYSVELGGFDTHADQVPTQTALLSEVDRAVTAFVHAVEHHPGPPTVVVVYTEFGRRVTGNASGGSDHGWANVVFVAGPSVRGGFYGEPPSLRSLSDGNLVYTTDFRRVYATVLDGVLGERPSKILGQSFPALPFV